MMPGVGPMEPSLESEGATGSGDNMYYAWGVPGLAHFTALDSETAIDTSDFGAEQVLACVCAREGSNVCRGSGAMRAARGYVCVFARARVLAIGEGAQCAGERRRSFGRGHICR